MKIFARFWIGYTIFLLGGGLLIIALGDFSFGIKYVLGGLVMLGLYLWVKIDNKKAKATQ